MNAQSRSTLTRVLTPSVSAVLCLMITLLFSSPLAAQTSNPVPQAELTAEGYLKLPTGEMVASTYHFELGELDSMEPAVLTELMSTRNTEDFYLRVLPGQNKGILMIQKSRHSDWGVAEWNALLKEKLTAKPLTTTFTPSTN